MKQRCAVLPDMPIWSLLLAMTHRPLVGIMALNSVAQVASQLVSAIGLAGYMAAPSQCLRSVLRSWSVLALVITWALPLAMTSAAPVGLQLMAPTKVTAGVEFTLAVSAINQLGEVDPSYVLPLTAIVTASTGQWLVGSRTGSSVELSLSGVADGMAVTLIVADGALTGTATVTVDVVATQILLQDSIMVVSGQEFELAVFGVNDVGEQDIEWTLTTPFSIAIIPSVIGSYASAEVVSLSGHYPLEGGGSRLEITLSLSMSGQDGEEILILVEKYAGSISDPMTLDNKEQICHPPLTCTATPIAILDVVPDRLVLTVPPVVVAGSIFELELHAENSYNEVDLDYMLSSSVTVTASVESVEVPVVLQGISGNRLSVALSTVADRVTATLTVEDGNLSAMAAVQVDVVADRVVLSPLSDSTQLRNVSSVSGGASLDYLLWLENAQGGVESDIDFSQLSTEHLSIEVTPGSLVAPAVLAPSSSANHIAVLALRYWPMQDLSTFGLTVGLDASAQGVVDLLPATVVGPVIDVVAERLVVKIKQVEAHTELYIEDGLAERLTVLLQVVGGESNCDDGLGEKVFRCVPDKNGTLHSIELRYDSTASRNVQANLPVVSATIAPGQLLLEIFVDITATLVVPKDLFGILALVAEEVGGAGLSSADTLVEVRLELDFDLSQDAVEDQLDGLILLNSQLFSTSLLNRFPELLLLQTRAQSLDAQAVLVRLRSIEHLLDVTGDGTTSADDALLILRYGELSDINLRDHSASQLPYLLPDLEAVAARLRAIY